MLPAIETNSAGPDRQSPLAAALAQVGDRWKLLVIEALLDGPARFSDLETSVPRISTNILSSRLKSLETQGLVIAEAYSERPPRYEYSLTAAGKDLAGALQLLASWGSRHAGETALPHHDLCGTPLEVRWYCPTCGVSTDESDDLWHV